MEINTLLYKTFSLIENRQIFLDLQMSLDKYDLVFDMDKEEEIQRRVLAAVSDVLVFSTNGNSPWKILTEENCVCSATKFYDFVLTVSLTHDKKKVELDCFLSQV